MHRRLRRLPLFAALSGVPLGLGLVSSDAAAFGSSGSISSGSSVASSTVASLEDAPAASPEGLVQPVLLNEATLTYPDALLTLDPRPEGTVVVRFVVGVDGVPKELEVATACLLYTSPSPRD